MKRSRLHWNPIRSAITDHRSPVPLARGLAIDQYGLQLSRETRPENTKQNFHLLSLLLFRTKNNNPRILWKTRSRGNKVSFCIAAPKCLQARTIAARVWAPNILVCWERWDYEDESRERDERLVMCLLTTKKREEKLANRSNRFLSLHSVMPGPKPPAVAV